MNKLQVFKPNQGMRMAKARLYRFLAENTTINIEDMTTEAMASVSKAKKLEEWLGREGFAEWWYEKDTAITKVVAGVEIAIERLLNIIQTPDEEIGPKSRVSTKDILTAADKLFQLADLYPKKKVVEKFLDKRLDAMDAEETKTELRLMEARLGKEKPK